MEKIASQAGLLPNGCTSATLRMTVDGVETQAWETQELGPYLLIEIFYEAA